MKDNIKRILREDTGGNPTRLVVFDFDGTLVDTGLPETHKSIWKEKTGTDWPHIGWWGRKESLDMDVFNHQPIANVVKEYRTEKSDPNTMVIMLTGRRKKLDNEVKAILDTHGLKFDRYLYNYGGDTLPNKIEQIGNLIGELPSIKSLKMFDDRIEHMSTFEQFGNELVDKGRLERFDMVHVPSPNH